MNEGKSWLYVGFFWLQELVDELGVYLLSFDRAGYGESDPNPKAGCQEWSYGHWRTRRSVGDWIKVLHCRCLHGGISYLELSQLHTTQASSINILADLCMFFADSSFHCEKIISSRTNIKKQITTYSPYLWSTLLCDPPVTSHQSLHPPIFCPYKLTQSNKLLKLVYILKQCNTIFTGLILIILISPHVRFKISSHHHIIN